MTRYNGRAVVTTMYLISLMLLAWMRLMVLMLLMSVLTFMTMMIVSIMILMMILTKILMMILMMILIMVGAGTEDWFQEEPYTFPSSPWPPAHGRGCVQISRIWIPSVRGKRKG